MPGSIQASTSGHDDVPAAAHNTVDHTWLVVWREFNPGTRGSTINGRIVREDRTIAADVLNIDGGLGVTLPRVAHDPLRNEWMVVSQSLRFFDAANLSINARKVASNGALVGVQSRSLSAQNLGESCDVFFASAHDGGRLGLGCIAGLRVVGTPSVGMGTGSTEPVLSASSGGGLLLGFLRTNADQVDADGDGVGDACEEEATPPGVQFRRGDPNGDGVVNISEAVTVLSFLFSGGAAPVCDDAADANDDARLDISDALSILGFLFLGSQTPPAPGPDTCGADPTADTLSRCDYPAEGCRP